MKDRILAVCLLVFSCIGVSSFAQQHSYVTRSNQQFVLNGKPYRFIGANYWYGGLLATEGFAGKERLHKELDFLKSQGVTNLRVMVGAEGNVSYPYRTPGNKSLQPEQGVFSEEIFKGLDYLLNEMGKRNMKAVLHFTNTWEWSGGLGQYLEWNGFKDQPLPKNENYSWGKNQQYISQFFTCDPCKAATDKLIKTVLSRTNSISKIKYTEEPAIMSWEIINEPRPMSKSVFPQFIAWMKHTSALIKSLDKNHLVTTGSEGSIASDYDMSVYEQIHADKNIDYLTIHIWPKNWGWFKDTSIASSFSNIITKADTFINEHIAIRDKLNKPLVIEEFGLPRDLHSFDIYSSTRLRDKWYDYIFSTITGRKIAGANFWAYGGTAKPIPGQVFWKNGDAFMGDPGGEEQGLNSVFNTDETTWKLVRQFSNSINYSSAYFTSDPLATKETKALYQNLSNLAGKGILFGHQDDLAYGVNWKYIAGRSDVKEVTGDYPAVYGWELGNLENDLPHNLDSVPFDRMKKFIKDVYQRGGINSISWHLDNPLNGESAWDTTHGGVAAVLPGGSRHELYNLWLDRLAVFMNSLKGTNGESIPVLFRPYHEFTGNWFWWCRNTNSPDQFKALWRYTIGYLRDKKNVHNLVIVYNTSGDFSTEAEYLERYPGDDMVDIVSFDAYQFGDPTRDNSFVNNTKRGVSIIEKLALEKHKLSALADTGYEKVPYASWWTKTLWPILDNTRLIYVLLWRNAGKMPNGNLHYYTPVKGDISEQDFIDFYKLPGTWFEKDAAKQNLYGTK
jgi:mannan endo-1,4-beta-mannosidase